MMDVQVVNSGSAVTFRARSGAAVQALGASEIVVGFRDAALLFDVLVAAGLLWVLR